MSIYEIIALLVIGTVFFTEGKRHGYNDRIKEIMSHKSADSSKRPKIADEKLH